MVSVDAAARGLTKRRLNAPRFAQLLQIKLLPVLRDVQSLGSKRALQRLAAAGSVWALLVLAFGGFYERPWQLPAVALRVAYTVGVALCEYVARGFRPLFPEWTLPFEVVRAVARCLMTNYGGRAANPTVARFIRWESDLIGTASGFFTCRKYGSTTQGFVHNGLEHVWVRSAQTTMTSSVAPTKPRRRLVVLYFHGGGYAVLSPRLYISFAAELRHRILARLQGQLGDDVDVDVLLANYRKIPEHAHPIPPLDAVAMYDFLLHDQKLSPQHIIVAGDSAGGGLAVATLLRLRDADPQRLPLAGFLICPYVDLETQLDERKTPYCVIGDVASQTLMDLYHPRDGHPSTWGDASPVHCDLRGLPPVYILAAEFDYILPHSQRLHQKAAADGAKDWQLDVFAHVPHVFTSFPSAILPTAAQGIDAVASFSAAAFSKAATAAAHA